MEINRRVLLLTLGLSLLAGMGFLGAALSHAFAPKQAATSDLSSSQLEWVQSQASAHVYPTLEGVLWVGASLALLVFAVAFLLFWREVKFEKWKARRFAERQAFLRQVREYALGNFSRPRYNN